MKDVAIVVKRAAAFQFPGAGHDGYAACRVHIDGAVGGAREAVAAPEVSSLALADDSRERLDGLDRTAGDFRRPCRVAAAHVLFKLARRIGISIEIIPVGF